MDEIFREPLTRREKEVAGAVVRGLSNRQIAAELGISPETVKRHLGSIYSKLSLTGRVGLAVHLVTGGATGIAQTTS